LGILSRDDGLLRASVPRTAGGTFPEPFRRLVSAFLAEKGGFFFCWHISDFEAKIGNLFVFLPLNPENNLNI
jgi:hypothetical protein